MFAASRLNTRPLPPPLPNRDFIVDVAVGSIRRDSHDFTVAAASCMWTSSAARRGQQRSNLAAARVLLFQAASLLARVNQADGV